MSDSDCSNCNDLKCKYREDYYNCYKKKIKTLKKVVNKKDLAYLLNLIERIEAQEEIDYTDTYMAGEIKNIIIDFKEALDYEE